MRVALETFAGIAIFVGMFAAVDCLPGMTKTPQHPHAFADAGVLPACAPEAAPVMLCNATTKTSPAHECVICPDPARHCVTSTSIYCATSCDEPLCERRK